MCRMLIFYQKEKFQIFQEYIEALVQIAKKDPLLSSIPSHPHGWGYVIYSSSALLTYKTTTPIYEDGTGVRRLLNILEKMNEGGGIIHVRKATEASTKNLNDVHPIHVITSGGIDLWVAHNGSLNLEASECGVASEFASVRSDTALFAKCLAMNKNRNLDSIIGSYANPDRVKTALDLGILLMRKGMPKLYAFQYINPEAGSIPRKKIYYTLHTVSMKSGKMVFSSSISKVLKIEEAEKLPEGRLVPLVL